MINYLRLKTAGCLKYKLDYMKGHILMLSASLSFSLLMIIKFDNDTINIILLTWWVISFLLYEHFIKNNILNYILFLPVRLFNDISYNIYYMLYRNKEPNNVEPEHKERYLKLKKLISSFK